MEDTKSTAVSVDGKIVQVLGVDLDALPDKQNAALIATARVFMEAWRNRPETSTDTTQSDDKPD